MKKIHFRNRVATFYINVPYLTINRFIQILPAEIAKTKQFFKVKFADTDKSPQ